MIGIINYLDNTFSYLFHLSVERFFRLFWFFAIFEMFRYYFIDLGVLIIWKLKRKFGKKREAKARAALWQEKPFVSIIIPGKNEGEHIYKLAISLREQTYSNFEVIVIDDGSDDNTPLIGANLKKLGYIDAFFRNDVRGGKASAANLGMRFARGKYIIHLDADCSYDRDAMENILLPFYLYENVGGVGGNVQVRNYKESICTRLQAIEYANSISIGRTVNSELGILRIISGAFGAFRKDILDRIGSWDIGPGLDGDITVKIRKLGFDIRHAPDAVCQTSVPNTFAKLRKQRLRWDKSLIRFRVRKHSDVLLPTMNFRFSNFLGFLENITYNLVLNAKWFLYIADIFLNVTSMVKIVFALNIMLYTVSNILKYILFSLFRERKNVPFSSLLLYLPLMVLYYGYFLRIVRTTAYIRELFFKSSYKDAWNPPKSSAHAKLLRI